MRSIDLAPFGSITSVLVERAGELDVAQYAVGDAETLRDTRSCTKTVLSMLVGIAIGSGVLTLEPRLPSVRPCASC